MSYQKTSVGDTGGQMVNKLDNNFTELYGAVRDINDGLENLDLPDGAVTSVDGIAPDAAGAVTVTRVFATKAAYDAALPTLPVGTRIVNLWETAGSETPGTGPQSAADVYRQTFTEPDWSPHAAVFALLIPETAHNLGPSPSVVEVIKSDGGESVDYESKRYVNGDLALFSFAPFDGEIAVI